MALGSGIFKISTNIFRAAHTMQLIEKAAGREVTTEMDKLAKKILVTAKAYCPVRTGKLRMSGRIEKMPSFGSEFAKSQIIFGNDEVGYAKFVEFGTSFMTGRFFLTRALWTHEDEVAKVCKKGFERAWDTEVRAFNTGGLIGLTL